MKMIVDIPDDVYGHIKSTKTIETVDYDIISLYHTTKNGTPVSTDGDLISRNALKKVIKSYADDQYAENEYLGECAIMAIIDNAPTVSFIISPDYVSELQNLNKELITQIEELERSQGDLISREVLKKHITEVFETEEKIDKKWAMGLKYSLKLIDNAPAIEQEVYITGEDYDMYIRGYKQGKIDFERPQGEWTNTSPYDDKGECSLCCYLSKKYYKFCPNCGAEIRSKE